MQQPRDTIQPSLAVDASSAEQGDDGLGIDSRDLIQQHLLQGVDLEGAIVALAFRLVVEAGAQYYGIGLLDRFQGPFEGRRPQPAKAQDARPATMGEPLYL